MTANLNPVQRETLRLARRALDDDRNSAASMEYRHANMRFHLLTLVEKLEEGDPEPEEPVPPRVLHAFREAVGAWHPGDCTCGGHVTSDGVFHAVVTA